MVLTRLVLLTEDETTLFGCWPGVGRVLAAGARNQPGGTSKALARPHTVSSLCLCLITAPNNFAFFIFIFCIFSHSPLLCDVLLDVEGGRGLDHTFHISKKGLPCLNCTDRDHPLFCVVYVAGIVAGIRRRNTLTKTFVRGRRRNLLCLVLIVCLLDLSTRLLSHISLSMLFRQRV